MYGFLRGQVIIYSASNRKNNQIAEQDQNEESKNEKMSLFYVVIGFQSSSMKRAGALSGSA